jgi:D-beta-D-heptose 7-phosphate kinase/D-beta-D-heptose 1-phosphate adenosyltransferase
MLPNLLDFTNTRVLVVGDLMLDRYWYGNCHRISPEAPVPIVRVTQEEYRAGGAANVAVNIASLNGQTRLLGIIGADESGKILQRLLHQHSVESLLQQQIDFSTITKLRVISHHQQLIRLDFENNFSLAANDKLWEIYLQQLSWAEVILISDYAKGTLQNIPKLITASRNANKIVLVDPKQRDFSVYRGASLVTPNIAELEAVAGKIETEAALVEKGLNLITTHALGGLLITRGELGMTLLLPNESPKHLPTRAQEVYDVTGAGDTVIAVLAVALAAGMPLLQATQLANYAAGVVVGKLGTATVSLSELKQAIVGQTILQRGQVTETELLSLVSTARAEGETIVFTNGCFDILHAGHVTYLQEASRLGNRLIVAVNADDTVRALKGTNRPIHPLNQRLAVLAALSCVDWVIPFSEPTPERLICAIQPDFLVKGGDNDPNKIPGANCVRQNGGKVLALSYVENCSTTRTVQKI